MTKICVIGATGKLGQQLLQYPNTVSCPIRFENSKKYQQWFDTHPEIDTVWHVARACRKISPRRDWHTLKLETTAMKNLLQTRAKDCRFVYASTKVVYGITNEITPLPKQNVAEAFVDNKTGVFNWPEWKTNSVVSLNGLSAQHTTYAITKLICERYISKTCSNYKILRIWDII